MGAFDKGMSSVRWLSLPRITEYVRLDEKDAQRDSGRYVPSLSLREIDIRIHSVQPRTDG